MNYLLPIFSDANISQRSRYVYLYLRSRADRFGKCSLDIETICSELGYSRATVYRALSDLEHGGYVKREVHKNKDGSRAPKLCTVFETPNPLH